MGGSQRSQFRLNNLNEAQHILNAVLASFDWVSWVAIPLLIFVARLLDVCMATIRSILSNRGLRKAAPVIGFFEVLIWLVAITQVMQNLNNISSYLAWAFGFSAGNYLGIVLEEKLAFGHQIVRIFSNKNSPELIQLLRDEHFGITTLTAQGSRGPVELIFIVTKRRRLQYLLNLLRNHSPTLFFTVEDVRKVDSGWFEPRRTGAPDYPTQSGDPDLIPIEAVPSAQAIEEEAPTPR
jgi:uncharacterized protein YebE (UPF0316 family)